MLLDGSNRNFKCSVKNGLLTSANATKIHYDSTSVEILLIGCRSVASGAQRYAAEVWSSAQMTFNWHKNRLSCANKITMN